MANSARVTSKSNSYAENVAKNGPPSSETIKLIEDGWGNFAPDGDTTSNTAKPNVLCISVLDISVSMGDIKIHVSDSCSAMMATMNVISPAIQSAVVCYSDFDQLTIKNGPVIRAPDCCEWEGKDYMNYLKETDLCGGGEGKDSEALHTTLWYILNDMIPSVKRRFGVTDSDYFPVMIFVFTDEDMRIVGNDGNYSNKKNGQCVAEQNFFENRWGRKPASIVEFHKALIDQNCWLRVVGLSKGNINGLKALCKENLINFGLYGNNRTIEGGIGKKKQPSEFENKYDYANIEAFEQRIMELDNLGLFRVKCTKADNEYVDIFGSGFHERNNASSSFLNCAYDTGHLNFCDSVSGGTSILPQQQQQQCYYGDGVSGLNDNMSVVLEKAQTIAGGGNAASCLAMHMKDCFSSSLETGSIDSELIDYSNLCKCKGCTKLVLIIEASKKNNPGILKKFARIQWAKMFAEKLFEPMLTEPAMAYTCSALPADIGAIYSFVTRNNSGTCSVRSRILSELGSVIGKSENYKFLREGKHMKGTSYDALQVINKVLLDANKLTPQQASCLLWFYLPEDKLNECQIFFNNHFSLDVSAGKSVLSLDEYKRFEHKHCFELIQKLVSNVKVTKNVEELKALLEKAEKSRRGFDQLSKHRYPAIPVFWSEDEETKMELVEDLANNHFDGRRDVASMAFISMEELIPKLGNLLSVKLELVSGGFASIKAVCAAAAWASSHYDIFADDDNNSSSSSITAGMIFSVANMALHDYVNTKYGEILDGEEDKNVNNNDRSMDLLLRGLSEGEIENNLSGPIFLSHLITWAKPLGTLFDFEEFGEYG
ncbi:hypothetical protein SK128_001444 [Halocaridina rubra]|uniref:Uncharacterized protein n=1 Tax=Halocaridina rubra TaxID=373956 RepID=A0AAN8WZK4_HALRR